MATALIGTLVVSGVLLTQAAPADPTAILPSPADPTPTDPPPSPEPSPSPTMSPSAEVQPDPTTAVRDALARYVASRRAHAGIAVLDRITGIALAYQDSTRFTTASVVKVDILATLLWRYQRANRQLSPYQRDLAEDMIVHSDNNAASTLWDAAGGASGIAQANQAFGLTQTSPNRGDYWGATTTTAADQLRLLGTLAAPAGPLSTTRQGYEWNLLGHVESDQRWGVPRAAGTAATAVYVKNGWWPSKGRWIMNSVGRVVEPGHDWLVAILSDRNPTERSGMSLVEHLAWLALDGLRKATVSPAPTVSTAPTVSSAPTVSPAPSG